MGTTEAIVDFVTQTTSADIPAEVFKHAKRHVIDTLGVAIGATLEPLADNLAAVVAGLREGETALWNGRGRTTALEAAWVNGTLAHALDFDDGGVALTPMHPSSPVLAAVWALSESRNLSGTDALSAYIVGLEVECKIASAISLSHYDHGWHATAVIGVLGAVAATSWLARLNADQTRNAIGIAASLAGGLQANFGTMTKPLHAGIACRNGLVATLLAKAGWTANPAILETDNGFFKVFACGEIKDLNNFGKPFHFLSPGVSLKRFPTCSATHLGIEAMLALKRDHALTADQVESIECGVHALSLQALRQELEVRSAEEARFSLHFAAAMVLLEGSVELKHFSQATFKRADVRALMKRVRVYLHPELSDLESKKSNFVDVMVGRKDGSSISKRETQIRGRAPLLLDDSEVDAKFRGCVEPVVGEKNCQELLENLRRLESLEELKTLFPAAYGVACFSAGSSATSQTQTGGKRMDITKALETDVLVIGAGNAASVAALAAHDLGAKVVLLERAPKERRGGNSAFSGGLFRFAFSDFEQLKSIVKETAGAEFKNVEVEPYPKDRFYGDLMRVTDGLADPVLTELLVERSQDVVTWMAQHGVVWELHMSHCARVKGKLVWRAGTIPVAAREGGKGLMEMHFATVEKRGLEVIYSARALELLVDQSGAVEGVLIASPAGRQKIMAKAMILACGGFEANPEMRARYLGQNWDLVKVRGTRYNTGDGIRMALDAGALPFGHWSGCHASVIDADGANVEAATDESTRYSYPYGIMVNTQGERFVDEGEDFQVYTYAKIGRTILAQPGHIAYQVFDQKTVPLLRSQYLQSRPVIANSVEQLAADLGIDSNRLRRTFEEFNRSVNSAEFDFSKKDGKSTVGINPPKSNWAVPLDSPPFHAYAVACGITFTYGGLRIDPRCRVLSSDEAPIPGLWAAGELTGGFFYHNYPSGSGLMRGSITGHIAGTEAAKYIRGQ